MSSASGQSLPSNPDLGQQRKRARELLEAYRDGDAAAVARVRAQLPDKPRIGLNDVQFVIAREYGFENWAALKAHIEMVTASKPSPVEQFAELVKANDADGLRRLLARSAEARAAIDRQIFSFDTSALTHVANRADGAMVGVLLEFGADPNLRSAWWAGGFHPLHHASAAAARQLLAAGAVPDACAAAHLDDISLLTRLLAEDTARVHERGGDGQTPLHFARSTAAIDLLLEHGADPDARDVDHRATPAQWMLDRRKDAGRYHLAAHLVSRGATPDIFLSAALGLTDAVRAMLQDDPGLLDLRTSQGEYAVQPPSSFHIYFWTIGPDRSPLQVAEQFGQHETLNAMRAFATPRQRFVEACARADAETAREILAAHPNLMALLTPQDHRALPDAAWSANAPAVRLMIRLGFDPFTPGHDGGTALHCAAWEGCVECVKAILEHPAASALRTVRDTTYGGTPLDWCRHGAENCGRYGADHAGVERLLTSAG